jgi:hypothetical protein
MSIPCGLFCEPSNSSIEWRKKIFEETAITNKYTLGNDPAPESSIFSFGRTVTPKEL